MHKLNRIINSRLFGGFAFSSQSLHLSVNNTKNTACIFIFLHIHIFIIRVFLVTVGFFLIGLCDTYFSAFCFSSPVVPHGNLSKSIDIVMTHLLVAI